MMRSMSLRSISRGMSRWRRSRIALGATVGNQFMAAEHGEGDAALGLLLVVALVALLGQPALVDGGSMAGAHDAVAQAEALQAEGLQQGIAQARRRRVGQVG